MKRRGTRGKGSARILKWKDEADSFDFCDDPSIFGERVHHYTATLTLLVDDDEGSSLSKLEQDLFDTYNSQ
jgi:hypothetical protein